MTCPNGHESGATDYCDVCGSPMVAPTSTPAWAGSGGGAAGSGGTPADGGSQGDWSGDGTDPVELRVCPNCGAASNPTYLFCEDCGYDFTTGAMPRPLSEGLAAVDTRVAPDRTAAAPAVPEPDAPEGDTPEAVAAEPAAPSGLAGDRPVEAPDDQPVDPAPSAPAGPAVAPPDEAAPPVAARAPEQPASAPPTPVPSSSAPASPAPAPAVSPLDPPAVPATGSRPTNQAPSRRAVGDWVVEVWVDPAWFEVQDSDESAPSPSVPDIVPIHGRALVGRYSASRRVTPEIDCGADSGVSRRHAEFTTDGRRWWVEDLGSSNGTFVGPASGPLPDDPIPPGQRVEIDDDDRIYVGAWTRLVLRRATASEVAGQG